MPAVSIIIPTRNRPELLRKSIESVRKQTYIDWELIVVDDGSERHASVVTDSFADPRIKCLSHKLSRGGGAARNTGIRAATGDIIAFQDDDDEWLPEKLAVQMAKFSETGEEVGFCFSSVILRYDDRTDTTEVLDGVRNHFVDALGNPKGYLTVTLLVKRIVFDIVGLFDEELPSHQESDLVIRIAKKYLGLGINRPLVTVNMRGGYQRTGGTLERRIRGREMLIRNHVEDFRQHPVELAWHYYQLGLWNRDSGNFGVARKYFWQAVRLHPSFRFAIHAFSVLFGRFPYVFILRRRLWVI